MSNPKMVTSILLLLFMSSVFSLSGYIISGLKSAYQAAGTATLVSEVPASDEPVTVDITIEDQERNMATAKVRKSACSAEKVKMKVRESDNDKEETADRRDRVVMDAEGSIPSLEVLLTYYKEVMIHRITRTASATFFPWLL